MRLYEDNWLAWGQVQVTKLKPPENLWNWTLYEAGVTSCWMVGCYRFTAVFTDLYKSEEKQEEKLFNKAKWLNLKVFYSESVLSNYFSNVPF